MHIRDAKAISPRDQELAVAEFNATNKNFTETQNNYTSGSETQRNIYARSLYLSHKIYGTSQDVKSSIAWNNPMPVFDYRIPMA